MNVELNGEKRSSKPLVECSDFQDFVLQVNGDPTCKRSNCHGKGYTGAERKPDGTIVLLLCSCGCFAETPFVKMAKAFEGAWKQSDGVMSENFKLLTDVVTSVGEGNLKSIKDEINLRHSLIISSNHGCKDELIKHSSKEYVQVIDVLSNIRTENKIRYDILQYQIKKYTFWGGFVYVYENVKGWLGRLVHGK